jgi:predicted acylesterase/phospholipase RssA
MSTLVGLCLFALSSAAVTDKCRALVLGGGSDKGAFQAGAIAGLIDRLGSEASYDVVTGVGIGSINGLILSRFAKGNEAEAATALTSFWSTFEASQFYTNWAGNVMQGYYLESGLYSSKPMKATIDSLFALGPKFGRELMVSSTDLVSGNFTIFDTALGDAAIKTGVLASSAIPGLLPTVKYQGYELSDGTVKYPIDIISAVTQCEELGFDDADIIVDIVMSSGHSIRDVDASNYKTFQVALRLAELEAYDFASLGIEAAGLQYPKVNFRSLIYPGDGLPDLPILPFDYSPEELQVLLAAGRKTNLVLEGLGQERLS